MRNTDRLLGGFDRNELPTQLNSDQNITSEPIKTNQIGLSVAAATFVYNVFSDVVSTGSTINTVVLTTHTIQVGDILSFTSGALSGLQIKVKSVNGLTVTVVNNLPSIPVSGVTLDILRYRFPLTDSSGNVNVNIVNTVPISGSVSATQGTVPWVISGTVTAEIAGLDVFQTSQYPVGLTATQITPTPLANRSSISLKAVCSGSNIIYVGNSSGVLSSTGYPLFNGDTVDLDLTDAHTVYAISSSATGCTLFALELA